MIALAFILQHWRLTFALLLAALAGLQTIRLDRCENASERRDAEMRAASAQVAAHAAITGQEAVTAYVKQTAEDRPVVQRVRTRILRECSGVPVAAGPGPVHGTGASVEDAGKGAAEPIAEDLADDVSVCAVYLERYRKFQDWKRNNGG
ncbi:MAG TPA: hypothetical protein VFM56_12635 [Solimonas sp.]|nr:hypothetical protein [Solimonas sp.]